MLARLFVVLIAVSAFPSPTAYASTTICHRVSGHGNTGNGYNLITVTDRQLERHHQHPEDLIPAPNGFCLVLFPPTTTVPPTVPPTHPPPPTTRPPEATTVPSQPPTTRPGTTPPTNPPAVTTTAPGTSPPLPPAGTLPPSR